MKRNIFHIILTATFLLSACGGNTVQLTPTAIPVLDSSTATPSPLPTTTQTAQPAATLTASITPLPTIPTFTPTFDARTIVTVTPEEQAICPTPQPATDLNFDFLNVRPGAGWDNWRNAEENVLNFLDSYGAQTLVDYLRYHYGTEGISFIYKDVTNDEIPELAISLTNFFIFGCKDGQYINLFELEPDGYLRPPTIFSIKDNNRNGIPELTMLLGFASQGGHTYGIFEWDQSIFRNLVPPIYPDYPESGGIWVEATGEIHYEDVNHDFINELILDSGIPVWSTYLDGLPWRNKRTTYQWNGYQFAPMHDEFALPEFRFQAIQDGDLATNQLEYDKAISLYQDAIFNNNLKKYSPEIQRHLQVIWMSRYVDIEITPTPVPDDTTEYPKLAAYSYYRIMLLHTIRGYESDAGTIYNTLQQKFSADPNGRRYAEMATAFWNAYQSTHKMYDGCAAAIHYADEHPEILIPLGSDYHGSQSHTYVPADVCPFR